MNPLKSFAISSILVTLLLSASAAIANESTSKDSLHTKMEPIVVNLRGSDQQYIRVELILQLAKQEIDERVKLYMPVIRHKLIFLLTRMGTNQLDSVEGKQKLAQESKGIINQAIGLTDKEGIVDVLFSSFIIQ